MRIGIIAAMQVECQFLRAELMSINDLNLEQAHSNENQYLNLKITHGSYAGHEVCLLESGIGKVNVTLATEWLIREFKADLIINTGSAGGIKSDSKVGDYVLADRVCHHDVDVSPIGFEFGQLPNLPVYYPIKDSWLKLLNEVVSEHQDEPPNTTVGSISSIHLGTIATGESFIYRNEQVALINERFDGVVACEMEAAAVAQVCFLHQVDFLILRNLSDVAGDDAPLDFNQYIEQAGKKSTQLVMAFLDAIKVS